MNIEDLIQEMDGQVYQYKKAARDLKENGYYKRSRPVGYRSCKDGLPGAWDVWVLNEDGKVEQLFYNVNHGRAKRALWAYISGRIEEIEPEVWNNYISNGWNTRRGLYAEYSESALERMSSIARSHADYLGNETYNSREDHNRRVAMRRVAMRSYC